MVLLLFFVLKMFLMQKIWFSFLISFINHLITFLSDKNRREHCSTPSDIENHISRRVYIAFLYLSIDLFALFIGILILKLPLNCQKNQLKNNSFFEMSQKVDE